MIDLITEALGFQSFCLSLGWRFCFIGGIAVQHWGEPRLYQPRNSDAEAFALRHRVLLVQGSSGIPLDITLAALPFEEVMIARATDVEFAAGVELRTCTAEDLIVLKCFASRPQDWQDVDSVLVRQGVDSLDWEYITTNLKPLVDAKEEPEIMTRLQMLRSSQ